MAADVKVPDMPRTWANDIPFTESELYAIALLRIAGCTCGLPLLGRDKSGGPRCRLCNSCAQLEWLS